MGNVILLSKAKEPFCFLAFCLEVQTFYDNNCLEVDTSILLSLDASQSSNQISSALVQNEVLLEQVNILNSSGFKNDLYKQVGKIILEKLIKDPLIANEGELSYDFTVNKHFLTERKFFKQIVECKQFFNYQ